MREPDLNDLLIMLLGLLMMGIMWCIKVGTLIM
jgi:hypothetical protein